MASPGAGASAVVAGRDFKLDLRPRDAFGNPANGSLVALTATVQATGFPAQFYNATMVGKDVTQWMVRYLLPSWDRFLLLVDAFSTYGIGSCSW